MWLCDPDPQQFIYGSATIQHSFPSGEICVFLHEHFIYGIQILDIINGKSLKAVDSKMLQQTTLKEDKT